MSLFLHVVSFPKRKAVKFLDGHAEDIKEGIWGQVTLKPKKIKSITVGRAPPSVNIPSGF